MVDLPDNLTKALNAAASGVAADPGRRLSLAARQAIWDAMGPRIMQDRGAMRGAGLRRRALLARLSAQRVLPFWDHAATGRRDPHDLLDAAERYLDGAIDFDDAWEVLNLGWSRLESLFGTEVPYRAVYAGFAALAALAVALFDETFDPDALDETGVDRPEDLYEWDAALFASLAASGENGPDEPGDVALREAFWTWYLQQAVPQAFLSIA